VATKGKSEQKEEKKSESREPAAFLEAILGKKIGMTQLFLEDGTVLPVTLLQAGPCVVIQRKTTDHDGYEAAQLGLVEPVPKKRVTRPMAGHFKKADVAPARFIREVQILEAGAEVKAGENILVNMFSEGDTVDVIGVSKGKGFQGVIRRHGFSGGRATHGSMFHRAPGSIGCSAFPSKVIKGMRAPGQMGARRVTVKNLRVVKIDEDNNAMAVRGAVPGPNGRYVVIRMSRHTRKALQAAGRS
jgi:large subunit ribosomal protein L3